MMKAITGKIIKTTFGEMLVYNEQREQLAVGDPVDVNGEIRKTFPRTCGGDPR